MNENLKTCPACGGTDVAMFRPTEQVECRTYKCRMFGPVSDPTGAKWNAMPRREQKTESRWYYCEPELTLRQYPEARLYNALNPDGKHTSIAEHRCIADGDKLTPEPAARALIASWQKPNNPTPAPEPAPADEQMRTAVPYGGEVYEFVETPAGSTEGGCAYCDAKPDTPLCKALCDARMGLFCHWRKSATPPTPQPQTAREQVWCSQANRTDGGNWFAEPTALCEPYILTSIHEAKWQSAVELAAIAEANLASVKDCFHLVANAIIPADEVHIETSGTYENWASAAIAALIKERAERDRLTARVADLMNERVLLADRVALLRTELARERSRFVFVERGAM
jgi:phosphotransferase system HPr-like phosphotransfer protein